MWIVRVALDRPYTFIVLALLILIISPVAILRTPTDIFPTINIPVIAVAWQFTGLNPEEMEGRITTQYERVLTTTVDNIEHLESTTVNGQAMVKIFLQPSASLDTANAQVTAVSQTILRQLPAGTQPPLIINYNASTVPILQLALSGLSESELNDAGLNFLRTQLVTVPGASIPYPYGGKQRQVMVDLDPRLLQSKGLAPADVVSALGQQSLVLPSGTAKIGEFEYDVAMNASPRTVAELNDLPVKVVGNSTIYLRDVAHVRDGFAPQTNVVRQDGRRGTLVTILKTGSASTLDVVASIRSLLPRVAATLPPELRIQPLADQSIFVRAAVSGVVREAVIAACLTAAMILVFLGSWRSTLIIAVSIPLSILTSVIAFSLLGETINIMTLGGLALAVGILVDDATVTIENIERHREGGHGEREAILDGAAEIAVPALVSTLCICIVFLPMFLLSGVARYLFVPLAEAVIFAMLASYVLSRTLVPTLAMYLLKPALHVAEAPRNPLVRFQRAFDRGFDRVRLGYRSLLTTLVDRRLVFVPLFLLACLSAFLLAPRLGENFFPDTDSGQFSLHLRAKTGTRIEETARLTDLVEAAIRREIPGAELDVILDNIGLPYSAINWMHSASGRHRRRRCRHPREPERGASSHRRLCSRAPTSAARRVPRSDLLLPAPRHGDADHQLRPARADRHPDRGRGLGGQSPRGRADARRAPTRAGPCGSPDSPALRLPEVRRRDRPDQGGAGRLHPPGPRQQPPGVAERELPDHADLLSELAERGQLQPRDPDAPVPDPVPERPREHSHQLGQRDPSRHPGRCRLHQPLERGGGGFALQHSPGGRHLRCGAGP
jgi:multidrug efflux pump subunit AcrB